MGFIIWTMFVLACVVAAEPLKVPSEAEQKAAAAIVAEVYKPDYEKAKSPAQKLELARKLLLEGTATKDDLSVRFVLFRIARDIAAQQGDLGTAFDAIDRIDEEYAIDSLQQQLDAATIAVKALRTESDKREAASILQPLAEETLALDRYELASDFAELALTCAREGRVPESVRQLTALKTTIQATATEFAAVQPALTTLEEKPTEAAANAAAGKFYAIAKGDWERGVPMLALGNDEFYKAAAVLELAEDSDPLKTADAWWKVAESLEGARQREVQIHAAEFYRVALPKLSGLTKTRVERAIASLPPTVVVPDASTSTAPKYPSIQGKWSESAGIVYTISQTGNQFKGTTKYQHPESGQIQATIEGTIAADGKITATVKHTQAPSNWQGHKRTAVLSREGDSIRGTSLLADGRRLDFEWKLMKPENPFVGLKRVSAGNTFVISGDGKIKGKNVSAKWKLKGEQAVIYWKGGAETLTISADKQSAIGVKPDAKKFEWRK